MEIVESYPSWQIDPCPPWCVVAHAEDDHEHDRKHMSSWLTVPAVELEPVRAGEGRPGAERERERPEEVALCLHRRDGRRTVWLYAGDGHRQALELTVESWARLVPAVDRLLDRVGA
ncbi:MAG TPA: hypothetical protein VGC67_11130 [Cellulomonas sp.]